MTATPPEIPQLHSGRDLLAWAGRVKTEVEKAFAELILGDVEAQRRLISMGGRKVAITLVTATPYTVKKTDDVVDVNVAAPVALTLPPNPVTGQRVQVQDSSGNASGNNITVTPSSGNVNGTTSYVISTDYARVVFLYNGSQWIAA